jgi:hypothetical protein
MILLAVLSFLTFLFLIVRKGKKAATAELKKLGRRAVNRPHFRDAKINKI